MSAPGLEQSGVPFESGFCQSSVTAGSSSAAQMRRVEVWFVPAGGQLPPSAKNSESAESLPVSSLAVRNDVSHMSSRLGVPRATPSRKFLTVRVAIRSVSSSGYVNDPATGGQVLSGSYASRASHPGGVRTKVLLADNAGDQKVITPDRPIVGRPRDRREPSCLASPSR